MKALEGSSDPLQKSNLTQEPESKSMCPCCCDKLLLHPPLTVKEWKGERRQTFVVQRSPGENFEIVYAFSIQTVVWIATTFHRLLFGPNVSDNGRYRFGK